MMLPYEPELEPFWTLSYAQVICVNCKTFTIDVKCKLLYGPDINYNLSLSNERFHLPFLCNVTCNDVMMLESPAIDLVNDSMMVYSPRN